LSYIRGLGELFQFVRSVKLCATTAVSQLQSSALTLKNLSFGLGKMEMCAVDNVFLEKYQVILAALDCTLD